MRKQISSTYALFIISLSLIFILANSWTVFNYPPKSVHQWRQSDCAAYVKTYYRTGSSLMHPATYNLAGKEGRVASEFPILYYIDAKIQKIVGEHYWVVRGMTFLCFLIGLMALLAIVRRWIRHPVLALFPVILLASSPYYYYYAINFLPNIPAISFSFVGLYFFLKFCDDKKWLTLCWGTLFFILSTALKPTDGGILWLAFMGAFICKKKEDVNKKTILLSFLFASAIIAAFILAWTIYVNWYNDLNGNHQNLIGIYPIWDMDASLIRYTRERIIHEWRNVYQQKSIMVFLILLLPVFIWKWKKLDSFLKWFTLWSILGTIGYSILWFKAFTDHDYYLLPIMLPAVCLSITVLAYFEKNVINTLPTKIMPIPYGILILLMLIGIYHNRNIQKERYTKPDYVYINPALYEIEPYLKSIGIKPTDAIVCVPDKSPNMSLNAINHYGYSEEFNSETYNISTFKSQGAAYLIINDSSYLNNPLYKAYTIKKIGEFERSINIFDIR